MTRVLAILVVQEDAPFLVEWLAHHRAVGVTDVIAVSCAPRDTSARLLDRMQDLGWVTHLPMPEAPVGKDCKRAALKLARHHRLVQQAEWILPLDIDEFVNVHVGDHTIQALLQALPSATAITLTRRGFGNGGVVRYADMPVTESFTQCAPEVMYWPWRAALFKTLYRNDGTYTKPGVHRPRGAQPDLLDRARWYDGHGRALGGPFVTKRTFSDYGRPNYGLVQLNHYPLGAMESFVLKVASWAPPTAAGLDYWVERNFNTATDDTIARVAPASATLRAQLMSDPKLARLHEKAVEQRKTSFRSLMEQEEYRDLFARLLITPGSRPVSLAGAKTLSGFANLSKMREK